MSQSDGMRDEFNNHTPDYIRVLSYKLDNILKSLETRAERKTMEKIKNLHDDESISKPLGINDDDSLLTVYILRNWDRAKIEVFAKHLLGEQYLAERKTMDEKYPCQDCGKLRTKDEGGTTFTVCDECWDKHYKAPPTEKNTPEKKLVGFNRNELVKIAYEVNELFTDRGELPVAFVKYIDLLIKRISRPAVPSKQDLADFILNFYETECLDDAMDIPKLADAIHKKWGGV